MGEAKKGGPARTGTLDTYRGADGRTHYRGRIRLADGSRFRLDVPDGMSEAKSREFVAAIQEREDKHGALLAKKRASSPGAPVPSGETTDAWCKRYLASKTCGEGHRVKTGYQLRKWVSPIVGSKPVATLTRDDLEEVRDHLDRAVAAGKVRPKTATQVWAHVTSAMGAAANAKDRTLRVHANLPAGSPGLHAGILPPTRGASRKRPWLYPGEWSALMACEAVPLAWRRLYAVALYTGLRPGELRVLTWGDVDLEACTVTVSKAWDDATRTVKAPKTEAGRRTFPIVGPLLPLLDAMRGDPKRPDGELVVPDVARGEERMAGRFRDHLRAAKVERARLYADTATEEPVDFRSLRDSFATWCALGGLATSALQRRMGHESPATTDGYVKQAEDVTAGSIGAPFPTLDALSSGGHWAKHWATKSQNPSFHRGFLVARVGFESSQVRDTTSLFGTSDSLRDGDTSASDAQVREATSLAQCATQPEDAAAGGDAALERALLLAATAGRFDVVAMLAKELEARRLAGTNVVTLDTKRG